jgi:foldase protein PrsA
MRTDVRASLRRRWIACTAAAIAAFISLHAVRAADMPVVNTNLGQANLTWQQRFLGIIPLVKASPKDPVVVTVDGHPITAAQANEYAKTEARLINATSTEESKAVWRDAVENLINRQLLIDEAKRRNITVPEPQVVERARQFNVTGLSGEQVAASGSPDPLLVNAVRDTMIIEKMLDGEFQTHNVRPTDQQIKDYYDEHRDLFVKDPGEVRISHIAVKLPANATDVQKKAAREKIIKLYREALHSKDFAAIAKKNSEDRQSAAKGGDLGFFRPGQLPPVVDKQVFSTPVGQLTPIIESSIGYSFIKVTERRGETYATLKEVKPKIAMALLDFNEDAVVKELLKKLSRKAKVEFHKPA